MSSRRHSVERCQRENTTYRYAWPFGQLRTLRRLVIRLRGGPGQAGRGPASRFAVGDWVRVRAVAEIRATLDAHGRSRGLAWLPVMWSSCGEVFQVDGVVRRLLDDDGRMRRVGRTVTLRGLYCDGPERQGGCGRSCPLLFRDEWLEPAAAPVPSTAPARNGAARDADDAAPRLSARVRPLEAILSGLDPGGCRDGLLFAPEMRALAGRRFPVYKRVEPVAALPWRRAHGEWFVLDDLRCRGLALGSLGGCDRGCRFVWHRDWLEFELPD